MSTNEKESVNQTSMAVANYNYDQRLMELDDEQKNKLRELTTSLNYKDIGTIQSYGNQVSRIIAQSGHDSLLNTVKASNSKEMVALTNELLAEFDYINLDDLDKNTKLKMFAKRIPIVGRFVKSLDDYAIQMNTVGENVDKIAKKMDSAKMISLRNNGILNQLFETHKEYKEQVTDLILAGKLEAERLKEEIEKMYQNPTQDPLDIQDAESYLATLNKRIVDLESESYLVQQTQIQIRLLQKNNYDIANKADDFVNRIIPHWEDQLTIAFIMDNQKDCLEVERKASETFNKMIVKNSERLKINTIENARANAETTISIDTFRKTTQNMIDAAKEFKAINARAEQTQKEMEKFLIEGSKQIETALLQS